MKAIAVMGAAVLTLGLGLGPASASAAPRAASISAHMATNVVSLNQVADVVGSVTPTGATSRVVVQRGVHGVWRDRQAGAVAADGTFRIGIRPSQSGIYALRVRSAGGSVVSATFYLRVSVPPCTATQANHDLSTGYSGHQHLTIDLFVCGSGWAGVGYTDQADPYGDEFSGFAHWNGTRWVWVLCPQTATFPPPIPPGVPTNVFMLACETN